MVKVTASSGKHVVAWLNKAEWDQVLEYLYCKDSSLQAQALHRISAWKSRYGSSTPFAVECTSDLVRCKVLDASGLMGSEELVLLYGMALVRFVNLITERKQKLVLIPLRRLANDMNIPEWIVNLRHELTHGKLPSLIWCRKGCEFVLEWLRREFWSRQLGNNAMMHWDSESEEDDEKEEEEEEEEEETEEEELKNKEFFEKVRTLLTSYETEQFKVLKELKLLSKVRKVWLSPSSEVEWILAQIKDLAQENRELVAEALLDDGFLIPTVEQLQSLQITWEGSCDLSFLHIPQPFCKFWQPLLKSLHSQTFTQTLLEVLFADLVKHSESSELRKQYVASWIFEILMANHKAGKKLYGLPKKKITSKKKSRLFMRRVPLQWEKLMDACQAAPCEASPQLLSRILTSMEPRLPQDTQQKLLRLCSIYTQGAEFLPDWDSCTVEPIYTVDNLQKKTQPKTHKTKEPVVVEEVEEEEVEEEEEDDDGESSDALAEEYLQKINPEIIAEKNLILQGSPWQMCSDEIKWNDVPLGSVPGQSEGPDCLLLQTYTMVPELDDIMNDKEGIPHTTSASGFVPNDVTSDGLMWTQSEIHKLKAGLQLF